LPLAQDGGILWLWLLQNINRKPNAGSHTAWLTKGPKQQQSCSLHHVKHSVAFYGCGLARYDPVKLKLVGAYRFTTVGVIPFSIKFIV